MLKRLDVDVSQKLLLHDVLFCEVHGEEFSEELIEGIGSQENECSSGTIQSQDSA